MTTRTKTNLILKIAAVLVAALFCALVPLGVHNSGHLQWSEAYADVEVKNGAKELLNNYAVYAGLTPSQFVATVTGIVAVGTGINPGAGNGITFYNDLTRNLDSLINAADYPAWDTMTQEQQAEWGDKQSYDSAKFNELMVGLGYGDYQDEWYTDFGGSGGGTFDPGAQLTRKLQQIGSIGSRWMAGAANAAGDLLGLITDREALEAWPVQSTEGLMFDATDIEEWPSTVPRNLMIGYGFENVCYSDGKEKIPFLDRQAASRNVYWLQFKWFQNGAYYLQSALFDLDAFQYQRSGSWNNAARRTAGGSTFSIVGWYGAVNGSSDYTSIYPLNPSQGVIRDADLEKAIGLILSNGIKSEGENDLINDYPDGGPVASDPVYYPPAGLGENTTWPDFETKPDGPIAPRPDNPYNPNDQTGGQDWRNETTQNLLPLTGIRFENLFPFSMLADIPLLFNKVQQLTPSSSGDYSLITIPLQWGQDDGSELVLDLTWLHDLLLMTRPAVLVLLVAALLWVTVEFWKSILTG